MFGINQILDICYASEIIFLSSFFHFERKTDLSDGDIEEILRSEDENENRWADLVDNILSILVLGPAFFGSFKPFKPDS